MRNKSDAFINPFESLPNEVLAAILKRVGPKRRTACWSVNKHFWGFLDSAQQPVEKEGGFGWTDRLPVISTIQVCDYPSMPVAAGTLVYLSQHDGDTISVIDTNLNQVIATVRVGPYPKTPTLVGHLLYVSTGRKPDEVFVIDLGGHAWAALRTRTAALSSPSS